MTLHGANMIWESGAVPAEENRETAAHISVEDEADSSIPVVEGLVHDDTISFKNRDPILSLPSGRGGGVQSASLMNIVHCDDIGCLDCYNQDFGAMYTGRSGSNHGYGQGSRG